MIPILNSKASLVSVIIPCFNHGHYLARAIDSVLAQSYPYHEIIVVDDGSSDNTAAVAKSFENVRYVYQQNRGLSAARNTGIAQSQGAFVVFLDADDWLYKEGLAINVAYLQQNEEAAFVSGAYDRVYPDGRTEQIGKVVENNHYAQLLRSNYIGMIAAVLFRREVLEEFKYDTTLAACEDYDLYLKIARKYKVIHHSQKIAAYYIHALNMSSNIPLMISCVMKVLQRQRRMLTSKDELENMKQGMAIWKDYYSLELYKNLKMGTIPFNRPAFKMLLKYKPDYIVKYLLSAVLNKNRK